MAPKVGDTVYLSYPDRVVQTVVTSIENSWLRVRDSQFGFRMPNLECRVQDESKPHLHATHADAKADMLARGRQMARKGYVEILEADKDLLNFMREIQGGV
jgi:hypothetical protein